MSAAPPTLEQLMRQGAYQAYSYSYPHKSAYRVLPQPRALGEAWALQDRSALFAYVHLPFCTMRCGFCNLFAMAQPDDAFVDRYVDAVLRQMGAMDRALGSRRFARLAFGGGTPSYLTASQLARLYDGAANILAIDLATTPSSIEVSPETVTAERLAVCRAAGVSRVSMGVQSFSAQEVRSLARPQQNEVVTEAVARIRRAGFPVLNLDLIYGIAGQTAESWLHSVDSALAFAPEELYLYPLYVRAQTGLGKMAIRREEGSAAGDDVRPRLYEAARERLLARGYTQVSMRMFRAPHAPVEEGPAYCCQTDGMVGFGAGARSYTASLHYSSRYAVGRAATRQIIEDFTTHTESDFLQADYGFELDDDEQRRRFVIQSLLTQPGLDRAAYRRRFRADSLLDLPQLRELVAIGLAHEDEQRLVLTASGVAHSDTIGPWLGSPRVRELTAKAPAC
jgi:oxygen-independent coproporphyrinogen-3 oxidase